MNAQQSFGTIAKNRRRELGLTQDELARRVGCAPITIRKIEADELRPSVQIAERMAMALSIPLEDRAAFVKLARVEQVPGDEPKVTPMPALEEIGSEDLSGRSIRGYALGERLGTGGMGAVYRAVQPLVEREVAIKIILPKYANHPDFIRRFEAEAQLVARLEHPHIVPLYDYWREPSVAYLVMRLLRGGSVQSLLRNGTALPPPMVLHLVEQISLALSAAHRAGVVHRDLKPANVLLDEDNNAYLADFGIAKNLSNYSSGSQADLIIGSPDYISPEQIRSEFIRPQTDIYALGVMLYELLTGAVPFRGPTPFEVMHQHLTAPLPPLAANRVGLPGSLDGIIKHATAKDPMQRYETVEDMLDDLQRALGKRTSSSKGEFIDSQKTLLPLTETDNPYKGLRSFGEGDTQDFFGREALLQQLLIRLGEGGELSRFLTVVGPSGSGKSSVVKAGLIPALRRGALPGSEKWFIVEMMPGTHPLEELEAALLRVAVNPPASLMEQFRRDSRGLIRAVRRSLPDDPNVELVLVIDQFEEVFTLLQDENERIRFLGLLVSAALDETSRIRIIITVRADFIDRPLGYMDFGEMLRQRMEIVLPLTSDEMERAIVSPADRIGLYLEQGLVPIMMHDIANQPGALPLLQYALTELFEKREANTLTKSAYQDIGGVLGALGRRAEEIFTGLDTECQEIAKQLFLRLVTLGEGAEDTRRRTLIFELEHLQLGGAVDARDYSTLFQKVLDSFGHARLLSFDRDPGTRGPTVEVAHEAILREWPRLRAWLNESRTLVRMQRQLSSAALEWEDTQYDDSFLLTGTKLAQYEGWSTNSAIALTQQELAYLKASIVAREKKQAEEAARLEHELETAQKLAETEKRRAEEQTHSVKQLRRSSLFLAGALLLAIAAAVFAATLGNRNAALAVQNEYIAGTAQAASTFAVAQQATARADAAKAKDQAKISRAGELAAQSVSLRENQPVLSLLMSIEALRLLDIERTRTTLLDTVDSDLLVRRYLTRQSDEVWPILAMAMSPDGRTVAAAYGDTSIILWDLETAQPIGRPLQEESSPGDSMIFNPSNSVAFSPDGKTLASASCEQINDDSSACTQGEILLWDVATGERVRRFTGRTDDINSVAFSPDGRMLASAGGQATILWDVQDGQPIGQPLVGHTDEIYSIAFSPDGKFLASSSADKTILLWDLEISKPVGQPFIGHTDKVYSVAFSPDGKFLASGSGDKTIILWDVETSQPIGKPLSGHSGAVTGLAFSQDGKLLASSSWDHNLILWDVQTQEPIGQPFKGHNSIVQGVFFSPDGKTLISGGDEGNIIVWGLPGGQPIGRPVKARSDTTMSLAFSPNGKTLAMGSEDNTIILWDLQDNQLTGQLLKGHSNSVLSGAFSQDGKTFASASCAKKAENETCNGIEMIFWDLPTGQRIGEPVYWEQPDVLNVAFSPDGKLFVLGGNDGTMILCDISNPARRPAQITLQEQTNSFISSLAFSLDGKRLASGGGDNTITLWDVSDPSKPTKLHTISEQYALGLAFSPDGNHLVSGANNGIIVLWDVSDPTNPIEQTTFTGHSDWIYHLAFSPDGKTLASGGYDRTVILWDMRNEASPRELVHLSRHLDSVFNLIFSPSGRFLVSQSPDSIIVWDLNLSSWIQRACDFAGRNFTQTEWTRYFPDEEYHVTCPQWPKDSVKHDPMNDNLSAANNVDDNLAKYGEIARQVLSENDDPQRLGSALDKLRTEMQQDPAIEDPISESTRIVAEVVKEEIVLEIASGQFEQSVDLLEQAKKLQLDMDDPNFLNSLCWTGSLDGYAAQVLQYCEQAVALAPDNPAIRDSRGLARALTGNYSGAIEDFQFFVENFADESYVQQRQKWITDLKSGINPFTPEVLEEIKNQ